MAWTPDGRHVVANRINVGQSESVVWLLDAKTGAARRLTPEKDGLANVASDISPDGRLLALSSNEIAGRSRAAVLDIATGRTRWMADEHWDQATKHFSPDGRRLLVSTNIDGRASLALADVRSGRRTSRRRC